MPSIAQAHILKTDGSIGAVLHVDPEDDPIAGSQTSFFFEFKDTQNKFTAKDCNCTFSISENDKQLYTQPLFQNTSQPSLNSPSIFYTFPTKGIYQVTVTGTSNTKSFSDFKLVYDIRVDRDNGNQPASNTPPDSSPSNWLTTHLIHLLGVILLLIFFIFAIIKQSKNKQ